jgi:hypothetical protein
MRVDWVCLLCGLMLSSYGATGQNVASAASIRDQAATITHAEIEQALRVAPKTGIMDAALRVVPGGDEYNVGVFVVRRTPTTEEPCPTHISTTTSRRFIRW